MLQMPKQGLYDPSATTFDWTGTPESAVTVPGVKSPRKKRKGRKDPNAAAPPTPAPAPGGQAPPSSGTGQPTNPGYYQGQVNQSTVNAPSGSLASGVGNLAIPSIASNTGALTDIYYGDKYGLGPASNTGQLAATYFDPMDKVYGITGGKPASNIDMINFGEQLYNEMGVGTGQALSPGAMMKNLLSAVANEAASTAAGGSATTGQFNPLAEIAHNPDPYSALNSFLGMVQGALKGTMPDDVLQSYINYVARVGSSFAQRWAQSSDPAKMEAGGDNFINSLIQQLGPTGGL